MDPGESSNAPAAEELAASQGQSQKHLLLPKSTINDLMKSSLPHYAKTANPARELVQSCVTEFIMFVTGEASDICKKKDKKTIGGEDVITALKSLGFDDYIEPLKLYLEKYRQACFEYQPDEEEGDDEDEEDMLLDENSQQSM